MNYIMYIYDIKYQFMLNSIVLAKQDKMTGLVVKKLKKQIPLRENKEVMDTRYVQIVIANETRDEAKHLFLN